MVILRNKDNSITSRVNVMKIKWGQNFSYNNNVCIQKKQHICYPIKRDKVNDRSNKPKTL